MSRLGIRISRKAPVGARLRVGLLVVLAGVCAASAAATDDTDAPVPGPIARIGSTVIQAQELDPKTREGIENLTVQHDQQLHQLEMSFRVARQQAWTDAAQQLIDQRLLAREAQYKHTTPEKLLQALEVPPVTAEETRLVYEQYAKEINRPYEAVKDELTAEMTSERRKTVERAYYRDLMEKYHATILVDPPRFRVAATGPSLGPKNASVTIILFSDFQCPYCARLVPVLRQILAKYPDDVRLVYRHLPLITLHAHANDAAAASVCADRQGQFWPLYDALFADQRQLSPAAIRTTIVRLGLDAQAFDDCLAHGDPQNVVSIDAAMANDLGLSGTPVMFINGRLAAGTQSYEKLSAIVEEERTRAHSSP